MRFNPADRRLPTLRLDTDEQETPSGPVLSRQALTGSEDERLCRKPDPAMARRHGT